MGRINLMPIVRIDYNNDKISKEETIKLSVAVQKIVSEATGLGLEEIIVYGNNSEIKVNVAPIEIFIEMSAHKISNINEVVAKIKEKLTAWKKENNFAYPINLTLIPMQWKIELGI